MIHEGIAVPTETLKLREWRGNNQVCDPPLILYLQRNGQYKGLNTDRKQWEWEYWSILEIFGVMDLLPLRIPPLSRLEVKSASRASEMLELRMRKSGVAMTASLSEQK
jgi:hypothetical protein